MKKFKRLKIKRLKLIIPVLILLIIVGGFFYVKSVTAATNCWTGGNPTKYATIKL